MLSSHIIHFLGFFGVFSFAVLACHYYVWRRIVCDTKISARWQRKIRAFMLFFLLLVLFSHAFRRSFDPAFSRPVIFIPYVWLIIVMLLSSFLAATDLARYGWLLLGKAFPRFRFAATHRFFWTRSVAIAALVVVSLQTIVGLYRGHQLPVVKRVDITLAKLPRSMDGFTIAHISDLHVGLSLDRTWAEAVVAQVRELHADLIALTGDIVDRDPQFVAGDIAPLASLQAPAGVWYVTGNHEYYSDYEGWRPIFTNMGMRALHNEWTFVSLDGREGFALIGVDDQEAFKGDASLTGEELIPVRKAMRGIDPTWETILLVHRPVAIFEAAEENIGLQLSGHAHGGQVWPFGYIAQRWQMFIRGVHTYGKRTQISVSQGAGYWGPPVRLASQNEIILLRLHSGLAK